MNGLPVKTLAIFIIVLSFLLPCNTHAKIKRPHYNPDITQSSRYASLVVNADTGEILLRKDANKLLHPASLTKMLTLWLTFQALEEKKLHYNQQLVASSKAASQPKTRLGLKPGEKVTVKDLIHALIIHSANDASVVLAEAIAGTENAFAAKMTETARLLGMQNSTFKNPHGLHHPEQVTTAYDMAKLGIALKRDYPKYYPLFSKTSFIYKGAVITGHNRVLTRYQWADGLKTGFINASGFNLVTSASRPEGRIVGVVMGGPSAASRDNHMISLLDKSFAKLHANNNTQLFAENISSQVGSVNNENLLIEENETVEKDIFTHVERNITVTKMEKRKVDEVISNTHDLKVTKKDQKDNKTSIIKTKNIKVNQTLRKPTKLIPKNLKRKTQLKTNISLQNNRPSKKVIKTVKLSKKKQTTKSIVKK